MTHAEDTALARAVPPPGPDRVIGRKIGGGGILRRFPPGVSGGDLETLHE